MCEFEFLKKRIAEIAIKHCSDYPGVLVADSCERLWAIEGSLKGTEEANKWIHRVLRIVKSEYNIPDDKIMAIFMKAEKEE